MKQLWNRRRWLTVLLSLLLLLCTACAASGGMEMATSSPEPATAGNEEGAGDVAEAPTYDDWDEAEEELYYPQEMAEADSAAGGEELSLEGESYLVIDENRALSTNEESMLTFSLKVDTAAYSNVARYIQSGNLPLRDAVRTEELINYFPYERELEFSGQHPFALYTEIGPSPFGAGKHLAFVRVKTEELDKSELPPSNLTFLIDTSGSMSSHDKLPLLKEAFGLLVETLEEDDMVSIVTYAGSAGVLLDSVSGSDKDVIMRAINNLEASGSTAGSQGIQTAYALAEKNFREGGNNRVILASDGDFNVGISDLGELEQFIAGKKDSGVYLSILGFGSGNVRDDIMETLATHGNGNYSYISNTAAAQKVLVEELGSNLFTIADDVKAQVEFNPANVKSYRLIGYENRRMDNRDFADDTKDAGEIGIGTDVVVLFEFELVDGEIEGAYPDELFEVRVRYKNPGEETSNLLTLPVTYESFVSSEGNNSTDFLFASSVAAFGHLLRDSQYLGDANLESITDLGKAGLGKDPKGYRLEYLLLLKEYQALV